MRKKGDGDSSLDLLLDTMCNTFGGIVFITILVALITNDVEGAYLTFPRTFFFKAPMHACMYMYVYM